MADNLFSGLPPPSSSAQQQELPISPISDESKNETSSSAPTLVLKSALKRSKPHESAVPNVSAPPVLKSALKRSKPAVSTPEPEPEQEPEVAAPKKRLQFKTSTDASEEQVIEAMQKITSHIKNPSKFSKASKLAIRLIQAGSVKPETSSYFIAILEAAMSSKTPCTDRLVRADFHALFTAAQDVVECLDKSQKNLLTIWTYKAVVANDLFTDDSFMYGLIPGSLLNPRDQHCVPDRQLILRLELKLLLTGVHNVAIISALPVGKPDSPDSLGWHLTKTGLYIVKSGYKALRQNQAVSTPAFGPSIIPLQAFVWQIRCPPKIRHFLWQAITGCMATTSNLRRRM